MKYLILLLSFMPIFLGAQSHIEEFDKVMQAYNEAYTSTNDEKKQQEINTKYEILIEEAEKRLEKAIEKEFQEQNAQLEKEQSELLVIEEDEIDTIEIVDTPVDTINTAPIDEPGGEYYNSQLTESQNILTKRILQLAKVKNAFDLKPEKVSALFLKSSNRKNGYSLLEIAEKLEVLKSGTKIQIAKRIVQKINQ